MNQKMKTNVWWNVFVLFLSGAVLTVISLTLAIGNSSKLDLFHDYFKLPVTFLLNWLPVVLLQLLLWCLCNRMWLAYLITGLIVELASAGNYFKLIFRSEPFVFSDISSVSTAFSVAGNYALTFNTRLILAILAVLTGTIVLFFIASGRLKGKTRLLTAMIVLLSLFPLWKGVYSAERIYTGSLVPQKDYGHIQYRFASKGFVYPFLYSIRDVAGKPEHYSEKAAQEILNKFIEEDMLSEEEINVIVFQLEAFADIRKYGLKGLDDSAYQVYDDLKSESFSGTLIVNTGSGGTINTEHCCLTGDYSFYNVTKDSWSFPRIFNSWGYVTVGGHPYYSFYNRENLNRYLGFSDYRTVDNYSGYQIGNLEHGEFYSDCFFFDSVLDQYHQLSAEGKPVFSFNVTMQGHAPYSTEEYLFEKRFFDDPQASSYADHVLNNYLGTIENTQQHLVSFVQTLRDEETPVVLMLYGDHEPWMGDDNQILEELGVNVDPSTEEGFLNRYSTEYVIWANPAAKEKLNKFSVGHGETISAGYLFPLLFRQLGWKGDAYSQYLMERMESLPAITTNGCYYENGAFTDSLTENGKRVLKEAEMLQYYIRHKKVSEK